MGRDCPVDRLAGGRGAGLCPLAGLVLAVPAQLARRQRAEEKGNKTAVKMLFPLVFCLAPPVYMMLHTPAVIELRDFVHRESRAGGALSASAESIAETLEQSLPDPRFLADPTAHREIVTVP